MALIRWEPIPMDRLINSFFDTPTSPGAPAARRFSPATDLLETDTHYVLRADLPGVSEDDVAVELENNVLTVRGERRSEQETNQNGYRRMERAYGSFHRSVRLPQGVNADAISATFERGVLEVSVPKPEQPQPKRVAINVGSSAPAIEASDSSKDTEPAA